MLITGGLPGRRGVLPGAGSSGHTSARSSDISTNSNARIRFTTFGGRAAAGLYGPGVCSWAAPTAGCGPCDSDCVEFGVACVPCGPGWESAAVARTSRPDIDPPAGVNVGSMGSWVGSGIVPTLDPLGPATGILGLSQLY